MPHPLSRVTPKGEITVGAHVLTQRREFSAQILEVIAHLAHIDGNWGTIFSLQLTSDVEAGTAAYQAFNGLEARRTALFAVAEKALRPWQAIALRAVWNQTKAARGARNDFVHHVWGINSELPDALLLMNANVVLEFNISRRQRTEVRADGTGVIRPRDLDRSRISVYRKTDFKNAVTEARQAAYVVALLIPVLKGSRLEREKARRVLLNEPRFQQAVARLIPESGPEVQAQLRRPVFGEETPEGTWG